MKAAERAFNAQPFLPLDPNASSDSGALAGRKRLSGAFLIEIGRIQPDPDQPRKNLESQSQRELTDSIRRWGILQPISVRYLEKDNIYRIISGERRYQAAIASQCTEMPCWVQEPQTQDILLRQIAENWQRAELHPYDLADALAQLQDTFQYTQKQLAEFTSKPESEISRLLSLLKLNPAVEREARQDDTGTITKRHLAALSQLPSEEQPPVLQAVKEQGLTAVQTEQVVKQKKAARMTGGVKRGAPTQQRRYQTTKATVVLHFRKKLVTPEDILGVLQEVKEQILHAQNKKD